MNFEFDELLGKTLLEVIVTKDKSSIFFTTDEGQVMEMTHFQDCCEHVYVDEIVGNLYDLVGSPILRAEESTNRHQDNKDSAESFTWTFYKLATKKGYVDIKWYGSSNGYYSESVSFYLKDTLSLKALNELKEKLSVNVSQEEQRELDKIENKENTSKRFKF